MPEEIVMPRLSDTMSEGTIARWLKKEGDAVKTGEALFEVETDKATLELQSYHDGTLVKILMGDGSTAPIGTPVGILAKAGETVDAGQYGGDSPQAAATAAAPADAGRGAAPDPAGGAAPPRPPAESSPEGGAGAPPSGHPPAAAPAAAAPTAQAAGDVKASPLARVMAEERGVDLRSLAGKGSGPNGRIVRQDVEGAAKSAPAPAPAAATQGGAEFEDRELNRVRQAIARN